MGPWKLFDDFPEADGRGWWPTIGEAGGLISGVSTGAYGARPIRDRVIGEWKLSGAPGNEE